MKPDIHQIVANALTSAFEQQEPVAGLLFHGTAENITGKLRGGHYDHVLWTADNPVIAQQYIPESGSSVIYIPPDKWELKSRVKPVEAMPLAHVASLMTNIRLEELERRFNKIGELESWRLPANWPTYEEAMHYLETELGYPANKRNLIKTTFIDNQEVFLPADHKMSGTLYVTSSDNLRFLSIRRTEDGDLTDLDYHKLDLFQKAADAGYDGVIINDFAQTKTFGNLGHIAYGLLPKAAEKIEWVKIPATHFRIDDIDQCQSLTPDVETWLQEQANIKSLSF